MLTTMQNKKTEKGFTLIELMIVVAIIGILAAIAIPQFASYRTKAFNSAALSDLKGARDAEEGLFADYQEYGASVATNVGSTAAGVLLTKNGWIATATTGQSMPITVSHNDNLQAVVDKTYAYATLTSQHNSGDKSYCAETDATGIYQLDVTIGTISTAVPATSAATDCTGKSYTAM